MKKIFILALVVTVMLHLTSCIDTADNNTTQSNNQTQSSTNTVASDENKPETPEKEVITKDTENITKDTESITKDTFFKVFDGYWGVKNDPYPSWDAFGYEDNKVMFFTYPGEFWFTDGIVESVHTEDDGTIVVDISYMYFELGSEEGTPSNLKLRIKSENDFSESFVASFGEDYTEYKYMGETFEQMKAFADSH